MIIIFDKVEMVQESTDEYNLTSNRCICRSGVASSFMEDLDETFILLKDWINKSDHYELDINAEGKLQHNEMIEEILPWDIANILNRYNKMCLYLYR